MRNSLCLRLAADGIRKNGKTYIPYLITGVITVAMYYIIRAISFAEGLSSFPGAQQVKSTIGVGAAVVAVFSWIFLFYTNSFLMKHRKKELGLDQVLGMEKRHVALMMFWETVITMVVDIAGGLVTGILFSRFLFLLLLKITRLDVPLQFAVEPRAMALTATMFAAVLLVAFLYNLVSVCRMNMVELLHSQNQGEREPKTRILLTVIGFAALGGGYYIAQTTEQPLEALYLFFAAVVLVIIGTYALFTAGSIAVLKLLRKNKRYYYKTSHFISVSGMIYRMKQNAAGLASICILSTMVLVMISTTVSLYAGMQNVLETRYPFDFSAVMYSADRTAVREFQETARETAEKNQVELTTDQAYLSAQFLVLPQNSHEIAVADDSSSQSDILSGSILNLISLEDYNQITGKTEELGAGEAFVYLSERSRSWDAAEGELRIGEETLQVKKILDEFTVSGEENMMAYDTLYLIVPEETCQELISYCAGIQGDTNAGDGNINLNLKGSEENRAKTLQELKTAFSEAGYDGYTEAREDYREEFYSFYGGFFFLGIFFGILFLMATVLIIYYKQISEGYDDRERFQIMQKVGMSRREVRRSIKSQVVSVFALPLIAAFVHICMGFKVIVRLLELMNLSDVALFRNCTIATAGVFAVIYGVVYLVTAREYYRIVR